MKKIIYIDDDSDDREFFEEIVSQLERKVMLISSGPNFFDTVYDEILEDSIIFVDLNLPRMSGQDIITTLRKKFTPAQLPIIAISDTNYDEAIKSCYDCGANAFIPKSTTYSELKHCIAAALDRNWERFEVTRENFAASFDDSLVHV